MSWQEAPNMYTDSQWAWKLPDDSAFMSQPGYLVMLAKLGCFLTAPGQVAVQEVLVYLPDAGSCRWTQDRWNFMLSTTGPLESHISEAALACGTLCICRGRDDPLFIWQVTPT
jgi:hypothetical protein